MNRLKVEVIYRYDEIMTEGLGNCVGANTGGKTNLPDPKFPNPLGGYDSTCLGSLLVIVVTVT